MRQTWWLDACRALATATLLVAVAQPSRAGAPGVPGVGCCLCDCGGTTECFGLESDCDDECDDEDCDDIETVGCRDFNSSVTGCDSECVPTCATNTPTPTPTHTPTDTPTHTPSDTPTSTPSPTQTNTPSATPTSTATVTPTLTPTATPTPTPVPVGGNCTDTAQCLSGLVCQDGVCVNLASAPASSPAGLLLAIGMLATVAGFALRRPRVR